MQSIKMKDLKKGEFFTLKPVEQPKESQVFIKSDYDRSERKYWATKWTDIGDGKYVSGDRVVYIDFEF